MLKYCTVFSPDSLLSHSQTNHKHGQTHSLAPSKYRDHINAYTYTAYMATFTTYLCRPSILYIPYIQQSIAQLTQHSIVTSSVCKCMVFTTETRTCYRCSVGLCVVDYCADYEVLTMFALVLGNVLFRGAVHRKFKGTWSNWKYTETKAWYTNFSQEHTNPLFTVYNVNITTALGKKSIDGTIKPYYNRIKKTTYLSLLRCVQHDDNVS